MPDCVHFAPAGRALLGLGFRTLGLQGARSCPGSRGAGRGLRDRPVSRTHVLSLYFKGLFVASESFSRFALQVFGVEI